MKFYNKLELENLKLNLNFLSFQVNYSAASVQKWDMKFWCGKQVVEGKISTIR